MNFYCWFKLYCLNTYLPGYKYIFLPNRIFLERLIWIIVVSSSSITAIVLLFVKKQTIGESTILVTNSINHPIWNYPFPAVTICSFNKISRQKSLEKASQFIQKLNLSDEEIADLLPQLGHSYFHNVNKTNASSSKILRLIHLLDHNEMNLNDLLRNISPPCSSFLKKCKWKGEREICDKIFKKILTSEGHCCSFNYYAPKFHDFRGSRYSVRAPEKPKRVSACGYQTSLEIVLDTTPSDYSSIDTTSYGHKIIIHNAYDFPHWGHPAHLVGVRKMALIGVNPTSTISEETVRNLDVSDRLCYYEDEVQLKNFQIYTFHNCLMECRMNLSIQYCGCIPLIHINEYDKNIPYLRTCSLRDIVCLNKNRVFIKNSFPEVKMNVSTWDSAVWAVDKFPCNCLPDCEFLKYDSEACQGVLNNSFSTLSSERILLGQGSIANHSVVRVFFNDLVGTQNRRVLLENFQTNLAHYGSILGFFVGFSIICGIEFVYFFSVKLLMFSWKRQSPKIMSINPNVNIGKSYANYVGPNLKLNGRKHISKQMFPAIVYSE